MFITILIIIRKTRVSVGILGKLCDDFVPTFIGFPCMQNSQGRQACSLSELTSLLSEVVEPVAFNFYHFTSVK